MTVKLPPSDWVMRHRFARLEGDRGAGGNEHRLAIAL